MNLHEATNYFLVEDSVPIQMYRSDVYGPTQDKTVFMSKVNDDEEEGCFSVGWKNGELTFSRIRQTMGMFENQIESGVYYPVSTKDVIKWFEDGNYEKQWGIK